MAQLATTPAAKYENLNLVLETPRVGENQLLTNSMRASMHTSFFFNLIIKTRIVLPSNTHVLLAFSLVLKLQPSSPAAVIKHALVFPRIL